MASWLASAWSFVSGASFGASVQSEQLSGGSADVATVQKIALGTGGTAGQRVDAASTLGLAAAWACISLKSELVGSMGTGVYSKAVGGGRTSRDDHWLYDLLHEQPNADQTPAEFWAGQVAAMDLFGNAYAEKETLGQRVTTLTPLRPDKMEVVRKNGVKVYRFDDRGKTEEMPAEKVFHLRGITFGGDVGLSPIDMGRRTLGTAMAAGRTAADAFARPARAS